MSTADIIYLILLVVNVFAAIYMTFLAWKQRKRDACIKLTIPVFFGLSVLGITQIVHLFYRENLWFTIQKICDIVQLLVK
jgi:hypothetical protein